MLWDSTAGKLKTVSRQRNEAWVGGPGSFNRGWIDANTIWYQSEQSGYSHIYSMDLVKGTTTALTSGNYEVQETQLSINKKYFYINTNAVHPGEKQLYRLPVTGGKAERLTQMEGSNLVVISPDEKKLAILYSYINKPTELWLQDNSAGAAAIQLTDKARTGEFKSYAWKVPELITFKARDGADVYARLYKPAVPDPKKPAVIFVHGAGYLQNAHKWWSTYYR